MADFFAAFGRKFLNDKFVVAILIAASFFVYANSLLNDFVWDDEEQVVNNTVIRDWSNLPLVFAASTFYAGGAGLSGGFYRPLVTLSYFWNYSYWGLNPLGYHLAQLFFHCANSILIFYLFKKIFDIRQIQYGRFAAAGAAVLFAVHPANVESVAYVASIGEAMYVFFALMALLFFAKSFENGYLSRPRYFWGSFVLVFMGLLAKESAAAALPLMFGYLLLFTKNNRPVILKFAAAFAVVAGSYLFLRFFVAKIAPVSVFYAPIHLAPLWQRLVTIPYEIASYLGIIFFPKDLSIARHFVVVSPADPKFWAATIFLVLIFSAVFLYAAKTKSKIFHFFILWFGISLAPVLNIVPLDMTMAERWLYFPLIGFLGAASFAAVDAAQKTTPKKQKIAAALLAIAIAALGFRTISRNNDWKNGLSLYGHDISLEAAISPQGNYDLENNYGVELFRAGRFDDAKKHFEESIALQPNWEYPQNNLGAALERDGDLNGALVQYRKAAEMGYYLAHENTAGILIRMKRYDEARKFIEDSLLKMPQNVNLQFKLAYLYAADNAGNKDKLARQKAVYLLSLILQSDPQNQNAAALYQMIQSGRKIEI